MKRTAVIATLMVLAGCEQAWVDHRQQAEDQWNRTRSETACREAAEHLSAGRLDQAESRAREALDMDETSVSARVILSKCLIEQGEYRAAMDELTEVLTAEPDSAEGTFLRAVTEERLGKYADALQDYQRSYELDHLNFGAMVAAGEVLVQMGRLDEAQALLGEHLAESDASPGGYELAGRVAMMRKEYKLAAEYYRSAWEIKTDNNDYLEAMGLAEAMAGDYRQAALTLTARAHRPDAPAWVHATLGDCQLALEDAPAAIDAYQQDCRMRPTRADSWISLAKAHLTVQAYDQVCEAAGKALELSPGNADALALLGYGLIESGQLQRAVTILAPAVQTAPDDTMLQCLLGRAYDALGEADRAGVCYRRAAKVEPENAMAWALLREVSTRGAAAR